MQKSKTRWIRLKIWDGKEFFPVVKIAVKCYNIFKVVMTERRKK